MGNAVGLAMVVVVVVAALVVWRGRGTPPTDEALLAWIEHERGGAETYGYVVPPASVFESRLPPAPLGWTWEIASFRSLSGVDVKLSLLDASFEPVYSTVVELARGTFDRDHANEVDVLRHLRSMSSGVDDAVAEITDDVRRWIEPDDGTPDDVRYR